MKRIIQLSYICGLAIAGLFAACQNSAVQELTEEDLEKMERADSVLTRSQDIPSPLEWADLAIGNGLYAPMASYFYLQDEPEYPNENKYDHYVVIEWNANFPEDGFTAFEDYYMQIQFLYEGHVGDHWNYINMPDNEFGLVDIVSFRTLENIPAYAFPYGPMDYSIRMRTVRKDFLDAEPNLDEDMEWMYDRSNFSAWSDNRPSDTKDNPWGFGKPQPGPPPVGATSDPEMDDDDVYIKVIFPFDGFNSDYSYSYEIINLNAGYSEVFRNNGTNSMNVGSNMLSKIGKEGGSIEVFATCTNKRTDKTAFCSKQIDYGPSEQKIEVYFYEYDFDFLD